MFTCKTYGDLNGDRQIGRRTFPITFGEQATRRYLSYLMAALPAVFFWLLYLPEGLGARTVTCTAVIVGMCWTVALRVRMLRGPANDHRTYMIYTYVYCIALASGIIAL